MNNYVVDPEHINVMLWAGMHIGGHRGRMLEWKENPGDLLSSITDILEPATVNYVGQMLLDTNKRAAKDVEPHVFGYRDPAHPWSLPDVLAAIDCYEAQTRQLRHWPRTAAHAFCRSLERAVLRELVGQLPSAARTKSYHITAACTPSQSAENAPHPVPIDPALTSVTARLYERATETTERPQP